MLLLCCCGKANPIVYNRSPVLTLTVIDAWTALGTVGWVKLKVSYNNVLIVQITLVPPSVPAGATARAVAAAAAARQRVVCGACQAQVELVAGVSQTCDKLVLWGDRSSSRAATQPTIISNIGDALDR